MTVIDRQELRLVAEEVVRQKYGNNFIHAVILTSKRNEAILGSYSSPGTGQKI